MVSMLERQLHSVQKRMVSNLYSNSYLQTSEDLQAVVCNVIYNRFFPIMHEVAAKGIEMDVLDFTQAIGMDVTSNYLFRLGNRTDFMNDVEYRRHWFTEYATSKHQLPAERLCCEIEKWCFAMCQSADRSIKSEKRIDTHA